ncbi:putative tail lysin [Staphylococcus phage vB_SauH_DELF3]|nr:putative tail lysin [Staphylococcus phage vB_SauH_DELF3]
MTAEQLRGKNNQSETKNLIIYSDLLEIAQKIIDSPKALDSGLSDSSSDSGGSASDQEFKGIQTIYKFLKGKGLSDNQVSAVMGNLQLESQLSRKAVNSSSGAFGIAQWMGSRKAGFDSFAKSKGKKSNDLDAQLDHDWKEMESGYNSDMLRNAGWSKNATLEENTKAFQNKLERTGAYELVMMPRINKHKSYVVKYGKSGGGGGGALPSSYTSVLRPLQLRSASGSSAHRNPVSVNVSITGTNDKRDAEEIGKGIKHTFGDGLDSVSIPYKKNY